MDLIRIVLADPDKGYELWHAEYYPESHTKFREHGRRFGRELTYEERRNHLVESAKMLEELHKKRGEVLPLGPFSDQHPEDIARMCLKKDLFPPDYAANLAKELAMVQSGQNPPQRGLGTCRWPDGATYEGGWLGGRMQGVGSFKSPDGSSYYGIWRHGLRRGEGKQVYAIGDMYDGQWMADKYEGPGRYKWINGNDYDGEWKAGQMHGEGILTWNTGVCYQGEFKHGQRDGMGTLHSADGSSYQGFWKNGCKEGLGFYWSALETSAEGSCPTHFAASQRAPDRAETVLVREYQAGKLVREISMPSAELEAILSPSSHHLRSTEYGQGRRSLVAKTSPETLYNSTPSYSLILILQLGIQQGMLELHKWLPLQEVSPGSHSTKLKTFVPWDGSEGRSLQQKMPGFLWKEYCPMAFGHVREVFKIDGKDYMQSICRYQALRELDVPPNQSSSSFFVSHDEKYVIKTMQKGQVKLFLDFLPKYVEHVEKNPDTLLVRLFGFYSATLANGSKVYYLVMNNMFQGAPSVASEYNLKVFTQGSATDAPKRAAITNTASEINVKMEGHYLDRLMDQLAADCSFLEDVRMIGYGLLLGVHYSSAGGASSSPTAGEDEREAGSTPQNLMANKKTPATLAPSSAMDGCNLPLPPAIGSPLENVAEADGKDEVPRYVEAAVRQPIEAWLGVGTSGKRAARVVELRLLLRAFTSPGTIIPMRTHPPSTKRPEGGISGGLVAPSYCRGRQLGRDMVGVIVDPNTDCNVAPKNVLLYLGIIGFPQEYNMTKRVEEKCKSVLSKGGHLAADPKQYSRRFQENTKKFFV